MENKQEGRYSHLERLETEELEKLLQDAVRRQPPDGETVRGILRILERRDGDEPEELHPEAKGAWNAYLHKTAPRSAPRLGLWTYVVRAASLALVVGLLILPQPRKAEAGGFFRRIARWTDSVYELFSPDDRGPRDPAYTFVTEHPGLRQVYDAVTELGITEPVVPMWLPEDCQLIECKVSDTPTRSYISARFSWGGKDVVLEYGVLSDLISTAFQKSQSEVEILEISEVKHSIMQNEDVFVVVWERESIECSIQAEIQEDILRKVIRSIYTMEENE